MRELNEIGSYGDGSDGFVVDGVRGQVMKVWDPRPFGEDSTIQNIRMWDGVSKDPESGHRIETKVKFVGRQGLSREWEGHWITIVSKQGANGLNGVKLKDDSYRNKKGFDECERIVWVTGAASVAQDEGSTAPGQVPTNHTPPPPAPAPQAPPQARPAPRPAPAPAPRPVPAPRQQSRPGAQPGDCEKEFKRIRKILAGRSVAWEQCWNAALHLQGRLGFSDEDRRELATHFSIGLEKSYDAALLSGMIGNTGEPKGPGSVPPPPPMPEAAPEPMPEPPADLGDEEEDDVPF